MKICESHSLTSELVLVSIPITGWQKKQVRLWILQALHSKFREAKTGTAGAHEAKWIYTMVPAGGTDI